MTKFAKLAVAVTGAALAVQGAFAGPNNDNLILSINNNDGGGSTEFTVSLGQVSTFTPTPNYDLSSFMAGYSSFASAGMSGLNVGVAGGENGQGGLTGVGNNVYTTTLRLGNSGQYNIAGTESAPSVNPSKANIGSAGGIAGGSISFGPNLATSDSQSFTSLFAKDPTTAGTAANNFTLALGGDNPLQTAPGDTFTLDLWQDSVTGSSTTSGWIYQGDLTFDLTSPSSPTLTWDASPVPEPSVFSLGIGAAFLALGYRKVRRHKA